ncbi:hypothetical protein [Pimelobacter simplex]|uniref:hypothetical protein n=1 Tax=Nocardioides simplex TaxID=2045 RepID=UPI003AAC23A6
MAGDRYLDEVEDLEASLGEFAFRSSRATTTAGNELIESLSRQWESDSGAQARLRGRTPAILERDRILFSDQFRKQDDKNHVLFSGSTRVSRSYQSHSIRAAHVARAVATRLGLNSDLAEAMALGAKVGSAPFIHVGKRVIDEWMCEKIEEIDSHAPDRPKGQSVQGTLSVRQNADGTSELSLPDWVETIASPSVRSSVSRYLPWCKGAPEIARAYTSGQQSYWELTRNPFTLEPDTEFSAQVMYGVWRHSLVDPTTARFEHTIQIVAEEQHQISDRHATHEAMVVRYADDITWVIENLDEASRAASLAQQTTPYSVLSARTGELPQAVVVALSGSDGGALYTYFINDLVATTRLAMQAGGREVLETEPIVALSKEAARCLDGLKEFLVGKVFTHHRVARRNETLKVLLRQTLDVLYLTPEAVVRQVEVLSRKHRWYDDDVLSQFQQSLDDKVNLARVCVSLVSAMSDSEVYSFIGLD